MTKFIIRLLINGVALFAAVQLVPGIIINNPSPISYILLALIFGLLNALIKPVLKFLTCPVILLTLGLFTLIINTLLFYLTAWVGSFFGINLTITTFLAGFLGALIVSVVSVILSKIFKDEIKGRK